MQTLLTGFLARRACVLGCCLLLLNSSSLANEVIGIGDLVGGLTRSDAYGVSGDGAVVAGSSASSPVGAATIWTEASGLLPILNNGFSTAVSFDGSTIVGGVFNDMTGATEPFRWTAATGAQPIGFPVGVSPSGVTAAEDVSSDGELLVGSTFFPNAGLQAFRWTESTGFIRLQGGILDSHFGSTATAVSDDGLTIAGTRLAPDNVAYRWTQATGAIPLGDLEGGQVGSQAIGISADGSVIVGTSDSSSSPREAFIWTEETGMVGLGFLSDALSESTPYAVTGMGEAVVGRNDEFTVGGPTSGVAAFLWTKANGMEDLQEVLENRFGLTAALDGWDLSMALDISADGRSIVGVGINPSGHEEGWLVRLDQPVFVPEPCSLFLVAASLPLILTVRRTQLPRKGSR